MKWIVAYVAAAVSFGALDAMWLRWAGPNLYRPALGELLAPAFRPAPALVFYALYIAGMVWFAVRPGIDEGVPQAVLNGALLGALCYATYDLTNQATMKVWPASITGIDIAWGAAATALASGIAALAVRKLGLA
ncbi:putative membrane protein [Novosphingobium kunmingense]|uniref:Putative membrane protein n=1 Tax=Novosphingobium kunmingense TaxID=1211806 RepID=A0A2N0I234_9SPHN|nr:DUF2177 family protein [Novosphingobium kunmingense]PKB25225.1 putative membrane protein [Novosphingobium kunmingense]